MTIVTRPDASDAIPGTVACARLSDLTDEMVSSLFAEATAGTPRVDRLALLAVGGYGRRELAPYSDLDLLLVHDSVPDVADVASRIWYPLWDANIRLGHAVRTPKETVRMCATDLDTATALLTARVIAGNHELGGEVIDGAQRSWEKHGRRWLVELHTRVAARHAENGEVAFLLEPNVKEGLGGLRDVHALQWAVRAGLSLLPGDVEGLERCNELLLRVRVALHRNAGRATEVLRLQDQRAVAALAGFESDDRMMAEVADAGRTIAWIADEAWSRLDPVDGASTKPQALAPGVQLVGGEVGLTEDADVRTDPTLLLRVATAAARLGARIDRASLLRLGAEAPEFPSPWPVGASDDLVALLLQGDAAIPVMESLDQAGLLVRVLPEWEPVRSMPQRNAFHRFTVDRHLWQTAANASALVSRVGRPDLLVIGALLHDLGKGYPGDHTERGVELVHEIGPRMGLGVHDTDMLAAMVAHHLLLADTATRRDLSDDATITSVAAAVGTATVLDLLHALTEADSLATGPSAWSDWKAGLVDSLVQRVRHVLDGGDAREVTWRLFPDAEVLEMMAARDVSIRTADDKVTVVSPDRPGTFSKVAGVLSLHGLDVLGAEAHSDEHGMAASEFLVTSPVGSIDWTPIVANLRRAMDGRLALDSRLADRAATVRPRRPMSAKAPASPTVVFDDAASSNATFLEVRAPDSVGLLHRVTKALADLGLDIRHARVQTLGDEVVDSFYVRESAGGRVEDSEFRHEITRAVLHAVGTVPVGSGK